MIKIKIPFVHNIFVVESSKIIESHLIDMFYPFAEIISSVDDYERLLIIKEFKKQIEVYSKGKRTSRVIKPASDYNLYHTIINLIRDNSILKCDTCIMHASFVEVSGKGLLFLGESGAGKSTLAAYLHLQPECYCFSDDIVYINFKAQKAYCFSKYINLRPSSLKLLPSIPKTCLYDAFLDRYKLQLHNRNHLKQIDSIFLIKRSNHVNAIIKKSECSVEQLIYNMYLPYSVKQNIRAAVMLGSQNIIYDFQYSDLNQAYTLLNDFIMGGKSC